MGALPATPHCMDYEWFQNNGDELADTMGSVAGSYFVSGLKVLGARQQGWTAWTGAAAGGTNLAGGNGTFSIATFDTTSAVTLSTSCLTLATQVYLLTKTIASLQAALTTHGQIGTTIS